MACNVKQLIERLQELIKADPSVAELPVYSNSPMDAEYVFNLGHPQGAYVGEVYQEDDGDAFVSSQHIVEGASFKEVRAVVIDTH